MTVPERLSIEVTQRCSKACWFCYSESVPHGGTEWSEEDLVSFVSSCAGAGTKAVSFGGGEPLEFPGLFSLLERLRGKLFRSITTNGLPLRDTAFKRLIQAAPDKVHVSIHFPEREAEVTRAAKLASQLETIGIRSGVNLLVSRLSLEAAARVRERLVEMGIGHDRIVFLPMRHRETPTPSEMARVAGTRKFQAPSCLIACRPSPRFCSISWDRMVGWCSYTSTRRKLAAPTAEALAGALQGLGLAFCGGTE